MNFFDNLQFKTIKIELINSWLYIILNRPESKNALSTGMINELINIMKLASSEKELRGVLLTGNGGSFCSGADLKEFKRFFLNGQPNRSEVISSSLKVAKLLQSFNYFPKLVIVCINGPAFAGGLGLACCSDFIFATKISKFGITETKIGLSPAQIAPYIINRLGSSNAKKLMLTGEVIDSDAALKIGLLDDIFNNEEEMFAYVQKFAKKIKSGAPNAVSITKRIILDLQKSNNLEFSKLASEKFADCMLDEETFEGLQAFIEKRKPSWNL